MTDHSHIAMSFEANKAVGPLDCSAGGIPYNSGHIEYWKGQAREARAEITKLRAERDAAAAAARFVRWAMQDGPWQGGDLDGGAVQDMAESLGLIVPVPYDPEKHGSYNDYGCDAGDPWFEFSPSLPGPSAIIATERADD